MGSSRVRMAGSKVTGIEEPHRECISIRLEAKTHDIPAGERDAYWSIDWAPITKMSDQRDVQDSGLESFG